MPERRVNGTLQAFEVLPKAKPTRRNRNGLPSDFSRQVAAFRLVQIASIDRHKFSDVALYLSLHFHSIKDRV